MGEGIRSPLGTQSAAADDDNDDDGDGDDINSSFYTNLIASNIIHIFFFKAVTVSIILFIFNFNTFFNFYSYHGKFE